MHLTGGACKKLSPSSSTSPILERDMDRAPAIRKRASHLLSLLADSEALTAARLRGALLHGQNESIGLGNDTAGVDITSRIFDVSQRPSKFGGLSDIYEGYFDDLQNIVRVAIKVIRSATVGSEKYIKVP
ncbi:hypothetical protein EXIGLDRAFT_380328 [Exidia glandulosa HHB12029]|uniref:Uncharacterized protein n=1 Tax=Exidia glandulosa HHB12029 TaxID=1314781 RepID=A0A165C030_EXIGL|nr:hypothetical protein EXIGLDRAFT_380328 [Exidia glandulosa HHB12029]